MKFDLRIPMGLMFTLAGMVLVLFGLTTNGDAAVYARSLGINVNLGWGLVLAVFGLTTLLLGQRGQRRLENPTPEPGKKVRGRRGR
ncbi:MAG: hypothetical protein ABSE87_12280 [Terracidiphilus sp.]|jgi:hypothetical protein